MNAANLSNGGNIFGRNIQVTFQEKVSQNEYDDEMSLAS